MKEKGKGAKRRERVKRERKGCKEKGKGAKGKKREQTGRYATCGKR